MTPCRFRTKPVFHETRTMSQGRVLCVAETPSNLLIKRKGTREVLELPWALAYLRAATIKASAIAVEKVNRRRARRAARLGLN